MRHRETGRNCATEKLVVTTHGSNHRPQILLHLVPGVGMGYTASPVAILLVEDAKVEHPVMDNQKEYCPFEEGHIESLEAFLDKGCLVGEVAQ